MIFETLISIIRSILVLKDNAIYTYEIFLRYSPQSHQLYTRCEFSGYNLIWRALVFIPSNISTDACYHLRIKISDGVNPEKYSLCRNTCFSTPTMYSSAPVRKNLPASCISININHLIRIVMEAPNLLMNTFFRRKRSSHFVIACYVRDSYPQNGYGLRELCL